MTGKPASTTPETEGPPAEATPPVPAPPRRRWRLVKRVVIVLLLLALVLRIALDLALPSLLDGLLADQDLSLRYEHLELSLLTVELEVWHLELLPRSGGTSFVHLEYLHADVSVSDLIMGELVVRRAEVDGVDVSVNRLEDGSLDLLEHFAGGDPAEPAPPEPQEPDDPASAAEPGDATPPDLTPPLRLDALRLDHLRAHYTDATYDPPLVLDLLGSLRLSDLGSPNRPARLGLTLASPQVLDLFAFEAEGAAQGPDLEAQASVSMRGLRPGGLTHLLEEAGLVPEARTLDLEVDVMARTEAAADAPGALAGDLVLSGLQLAADGQPCLALDAVDVRLAGFSAGDQHLARVAVSGVRGEAWADASGALHAGGLVFAASPPGAEAPPEEDEEPPTPAGDAPRVRLDALTLGDVQLRWRDEGTTPPVDLALALEAELSDLDTHPGAGGPPLSLEIRAGVPEVLGALEVTGAVQAFIPDARADLSVAARQVTLDGIRPYLDGAGLEDVLDDGDLALGLSAHWSVDANGALRAGAELTDLQFTDGAPLLALDRIGLEGIARVDATAPLTVEAAALEGLRLVVHRLDTSDGQPPALNLLGVSPRGVAVPEDAATPVFEVGPGTIALQQLVLGNAHPVFASLAGQLPVPGVIEALTVSGAWPDDGPLDLALGAEGLGLSRLEPWLAPTGIRPELGPDGRLGARLTVDLINSAEGTLLDLSLAEGVLTDGTTDLARWDHVGVDDLLLGEQAPDLGEAALSGLAITVRRDAEGLLHVLGLALGAPAAGSGELSPEAPPEAASLAAGPTGHPGPADATATSAAAPDPAGTTEGPVLRRLALDDVSLRWIDENPDAPVDTTARLTARVDDLVLGSGQPGPFEATVEAPGLVERLTVQGEVELGEHAALSLDVAARGVVPSLLPVPPGASLDLTDGRIAMHAEARVEPHPDGGQRLSAALTELSLVDGHRELVRVGEVSAEVPRLDPEGGTIDVTSVRLDGVRAELWRDVDGRLHALGLALAPTPEDGDDIPGEPLAAGPGTGPGPDADPEAAVPAVTSPPAAPPGARSVLPDLHLGELSLGIEAIRVTDERHPDAPPIVLRDVRLATAGAVDVDGEAPEDSAPIELTLTAQLEPLLDEARVDLRLSPFASDVTAEVDVTLDGLRGTELERALPDLARTLDASGLEDGRMHLTAEALLRNRRRGPLAFEMGAGPDVEVVLGDLLFEDRADGNALLALEELRLDVASLTPERAHLRSVEVLEPSISALKTPRGWQVLDVVLLTPPALEGEEGAGGDVGEDDAEASNAEATAAAAPAEELPGSQAAFRVQVDELSVSGVDVLVEDPTVTPPLKLPLDELEIDMRDLVLGSDGPGRPLRLSLVAGTGRVPEPGAEPDEQGVMPTLTVFDQLTVDARLALEPTTSGWVKVDLSGLHLLTLAGPAGAAGVTVEGGTVDLVADARFDEDGSLDLSTLTLLTDLDMTEPKGGFVSRTLGLSAPLDVVIVVLRDETGTIQLPINVSVGSEGVSAAEIGAVTASTLTRLVTRAIATSPLRVAGTVGDVLTFFTNDEKPDPGDREAVAMPFEAGLARPSPDGLRTILGLIEELKRDRSLVVTLRHEIGPADVRLAKHLANPSPDLCRDLATLLRGKREALLEQRAAVASVATTSLLVGMDRDAEASRVELIELDRELALTENGLDMVLEALRSSDDRSAAQRTREALLSLANLRLTALRDELVRRIGADQAGRVRIVRPRAGTPQGEGAGRALLSVSRRRG